MKIVRLAIGAIIIVAVAVILIWRLDIGAFPST